MTKFVPCSRFVLTCCKDIITINYVKKGQNNLTDFHNHKTGESKEIAMKSILIKDTTKEERIALIREWLPVDDGLEDCEIDLWDMYDDYIKGKREIAEINESFRADYVMDDPEPKRG